MTRIYQNPAPAADAPCLRALILGAGHYANAQVAMEGVPRLPDLSSVGESMRKFATKLIGDWQPTLQAPLFSVDLLLCEPEFEVSRWVSAGAAAGEVPDSTPIDPPTLANVRAALTNALDGAKPADHFVFMCCGHGFSKDKSYFILSDFASDTNEVWSNVINLTEFCQGMGQKEPRNQWFFLDCCADIPDAVLRVLTTTIGQALVTPDAGKLGSALRRFGPLSSFKLASATQGAEALGIANRPSRFCEMLLEAIDGSGATGKNNEGIWTVDDIGIGKALKSFARRKCSFEEAKRYTFTVPMATDSPERMPFRRLDHEPRSCFVTFSTPREKIMGARISIVDPASGAPIFVKEEPGNQERIVVELLPRKPYTFKAEFDGATFERDIFGELPEAEPGQLELK